MSRVVALGLYIKIDL